MSGSIDDPILVLFNLQVSGWLFESDGLKLLTVSLGELKECQTSTDSLQQLSVLPLGEEVGEGVCELEDSELYGSFIDSYPIIEDYLKGHGVIFTKQPSRHFKAVLSRKHDQMSFPVFSCLDSFTSPSRKPCMLVPFCVIFDSIKLDTVSVALEGPWRVVRQNFAEFAFLEENDETEHQGNTSEIGNGTSDSRYPDKDVDDDCEQSSDGLELFKKQIKSFPKGFMNLRHVKLGDFIGPVVVGSPSFYDLFLPSLLYAISLGHVPSHIRAPVSYLRTHNYPLSRRLHYYLTGQWMVYPDNKQCAKVEKMVAAFCGTPPYVLTYNGVNDPLLNDYNVMKDRLKQTLFDESQGKHQLLSVLIPPLPCNICSTQDEIDTQFVLANDLIFIALRQLTSFLSLLKINLISLVDHVSHIRTQNVSIKQTSPMTQALTELYYKRRIQARSDLHVTPSNTTFPLWHKENPPYWTILIISPINSSEWIRFDIPYLIPSVSTFLFLTYLQLLIPSATKLPSKICLHPKSLISASTNERIILQMEVLCQENYVPSNSNFTTSDVSRRDCKGHEIESFSGRASKKIPVEGQLGSNSNKEQVRSMFY